MRASQLELNLWQSLKNAAIEPEAANLEELWQAVEKTIEGLPNELRLQTVGQAIEQIAELIALRSDWMLTAWEEAHNSWGPIVREEAIAGLVRQTMTLDLSELVDSRAMEGRSRKQLELDTSVAGSVDKRNLLKVIESIEAAELQTPAVQDSLEQAHSEDTAQWVEVIAQWMKDQGEEEMISLVQLQQALGMPLVEVWLGLLHSSKPTYSLTQQSEFYDPQGLWLSVQG